MGPDETTCLSRLCNKRRISVGCFGMRMAKLGRERRTHLHLAENEQKARVRIRGGLPAISPNGIARYQAGERECEENLFLNAAERVSPN
jgi:hypothetical protein